MEKRKAGFNQRTVVIRLKGGNDLPPFVLLISEFMLKKHV